MLDNNFCRQFYNIPKTVPDKNIKKFVDIYNEIDILNENQELTNSKLEKLRQKLRNLEEE